MLETEIWPTLYREIGRRRPPAGDGERADLDAVGRALSPHGLAVPRHAVAGTYRSARRAAADAERFLALGAPEDRVRVTGNVKFDLEIPADRWWPRGSNCASAWRQGGRSGSRAARTTARSRPHSRRTRRCARGIPSALLMLVPRHPQRFESVRALLRKAAGTGLRNAAAAHCRRNTTRCSWSTRSASCRCSTRPRTSAFVGGSLVPIGGPQPARARGARPADAVGARTRNAPDVADAAREAGALRIVRDADELAPPRARVPGRSCAARARTGAQGRAAVAANRGAVEPRRRDGAAAAAQRVGFGSSAASSAASGSR